MDRGQLAFLVLLDFIVMLLVPFDHVTKVKSTSTNRNKTDVEQNKMCFAIAVSRQIPTVSFTPVTYRTSTEKHRSTTKNDHGRSLLFRAVNSVFYCIVARVIDCAKQHYRRQSLPIFTNERIAKAYQQSLVFHQLRKHFIPLS
jgi:hypothetical protein